MHSTIIAAAVVLAAGVAQAEAPAVVRDRMQLVRTRMPLLLPMADSHIMFMNSCRPNGCMVKTGTTDSRTNTSAIAMQNTTLSAWSHGQTKWDETMTCMRDVFSRWNVQITDVDPGTTPHYEIMVAGTPQQILGAQGFGVGGVAEFPCTSIGQCDPYIPNVIVFAFAGVLGGNVNLTCAVAAQEIAHTWALDHVIDASDPLSYNPFNGIRQFHDNQKCGSDCQGGQSPFGLPCTGTGGQATHLCSGNNQPTQNEVQVITALFGSSGPATPPSVVITAPGDGAMVTAGFAVVADVTDDLGVAKVELRIDGSLIGTVTTAPYAWSAPASVGQGSHLVSVTGYDVGGATAEAHVTVTLGAACSKPSDCPNDTETCVDGRCVPGTDVPGGLGTPCTSNTDCASGQCGQDASGNRYCVEQCEPANDACPPGFECTASGGGSVCWPATGTGGGCAAGGFAGAGGFVLFVAGLLVTSNRRPPRRSRRARATAA